MAKHTLNFYFLPGQAEELELAAHTLRLSKSEVIRWAWVLSRDTIRAIPAPYPSTSEYERTWGTRVRGRPE